MIPVNLGEIPNPTMDILQKAVASLSLTPDAVGGWSATAHATAVVIVIATVAWLGSYRTQQKRKRELAKWIRRAQQEKSSKDHKDVLAKSISIADEHKLFLSAKETRDLVIDKKLDPRDNVAHLSQRCHDLNLSREGVNAIAEEFYDEAYQAAGALDLSCATKSTAPPLFGVPICVKECIAVKGAYSTGGLACRLNHKMTEDSLTVALLRTAGAIPLCTTNTIQLMMLPECYNHIWGRTRNPWDLSRSPGGSSGGDAALVAMGCVPLAAASDVAGSIRIPACFSGVVGFKPTSTRLSGRGSMKPRKDNKAGTSIVIPATNGPIARTAEDCAFFMKAVCTPDLFAGDLNVPPLPFDDKAYEDKSKLKIGYFRTDGWFEPCATSKRALDETLAALTKAGHTCVPFEPPTDGWHNYGLLLGINAAEGNAKSYLEALEGEDIIDAYAPLILASSIPNWIRWVLCKVLDKRRAHLLGSSRNGGVSVFELWKRTAEVLDLRTAWSNSVRESGVDAIVYPGFPIPALPHGLSGDLTAAVSYMFLANLLLWPAGTVPVTTVRPDEQHYRMEDLPHNQRDKAAQLTASLVMRESAGLPISVSVMTPAFQDEKCLRAMKEIESLVNFKESPSAYKE